MDKNKSKVLKVILEKGDRTQGIMYWSNTGGLEVGMVDPFTGCRIVNIEKVILPKNEIVIDR